MSEKITILVAAWSIIILFITSGTELEIFFILILIGFVAIKEFTDRYTSVNLKRKFNIFIFAFLIIFIVIITEKIINILNI